MTQTVSESLFMERCNLTTPTSSSVVNCRGSFNQIFLVPGNYSISIELEDLNGNKAGPFKHKWIVSTYLPAFVCISHVQVVVSFVFSHEGWLNNNLFIYIFLDITLSTKILKNPIYIYNIINKELLFCFSCCIICFYHTKVMMIVIIWIIG